MDGDASNRSAWREIAGAFFKLGPPSYGGPAIMGRLIDYASLSET